MVRESQQVHDTNEQYYFNLDHLHHKVEQKVAEKKELKKPVMDGEDVRSNRNKARLFKLPENDTSIQEVSQKKFAPQSCRKIRWAVNLYSDSHSNRLRLPGVSTEISQANLEMLYSFTNYNLAFSLLRFVR